MNTTARGLAICTVVALGTLSAAGCAQRQIGVSGPDAAAVRALDEQERQAVLAEDIAALERLWSEQLIVNNPQGRVAATRRDVIGLVQRGLLRYATFERNVEAVRQNGDVVIVMGAEQVVPAGDGNRAGQTVRRRFTNIWMKEAGHWRMIARHANAAN